MIRSEEHGLGYDRLTIHRGLIATEDVNGHVKLTSDLTLDSTETAVSASAVKSLNDKLQSGVVNAPSVSFGANTIKHTGATSVYPEIEFTGMHYVNLLGKDGDCESITNYVTSSSVVDDLDSTMRVFGNNSIKLTLTADAATYGFIKFTPTLNKYYFISGYVRNGNLSSGIRLRVLNVGDMTLAPNPYITDTTQFIRQGVKMQPTDFADATETRIALTVSGLTGQYAYYDGLMCIEITEDEYNILTTDQLLSKYPYVESYGVLTNPYFENRRDNLVRNGNGEEGIGWWKVVPSGSAKISIESGKFKIVTVGVWDGYTQIIKVKPNTNYYISANLSEYAYISVKDETIINPIRDGVGTFNSGNYTTISVSITNSAIGTGYFDSIMLVEGTTAPTEYKSCDLQYFMIEGQFTSDDKVVIKDGKVSGWKYWGHRTLYGKDYNWQLSSDYTGVKRIKLTLLTAIGQNFVSGGGNIEVKYDGKILTSGVTTDSVADRFSGSTNNDINLITVADTDSGWQESKNPNNDEVKAFMNGWRAVASTSTRYITWVGVVDGKLPPGFFNTTATAASTNVNYVDVVDASGFVIGDAITTQNDGASWSDRTITNISGNRITLNSNVTVAVGSIITKADNGTTQLSMLEYCRNNIALGYEGYRLHYKLATPEQITDANTHIEGSIWSITTGDNYVTVNSGIVIREVVDPLYYSTNRYIGISDISRANYSPLRYADDGLSIQVYKDGIYDTDWSYSTSVDASGYVFTAMTNFNINATYTVDYQILKTVHAQSFSNLSIKYAQDVFSAIGSIAGAVETAYSKINQLADSYPEYQTILVTGTKTLGMNDRYTIQKCLSASTITIVVPLESTVRIPINTEIVLVRFGAGDVTISNQTGVTIYSSESKRNINKQYEAVTLKKVSENEWLLIGSLAT